MTLRVHPSGAKCTAQTDYRTHKPPYAKHAFTLRNAIVMDKVQTIKDTFVKEKFQIWLLLVPAVFISLA